MQNKEMQIIRLALIVLFSSLMIIYIMLYQIKGEEITGQLSVTKQTSISNNQTKIEQNTQETSSSKTPSSWFFEDQSAPKAIDENKEKEENSQSIRILSGTKLFYGVIESIDALGLSYEYALEGSSGMYYVKFDQEPVGLVDIVRSLSGSIYTISTEQDLLKNQLFGQKVVYINLPAYKDKKVLMMVVFQKEVRIMDIPYLVYHKSKGYLKSLFMNN